MKHKRQWMAALDEVPSGNISAVAAMLYFDRTGERRKPRLACVNGGPPRRVIGRPRPQLRLVVDRSAQFQD